MNLEPIYEQILQDMSERDVRHASYWSLFATPPSGLTYGANGIWPWLQDGESILNHRDAPWTDTWRESLVLLGARQMGYLCAFIRRFEWWTLRPAHGELLLEQPGNETFRHFGSVLRTVDFETVLVYLPGRLKVRLRNPNRFDYSAEF